MGTRRQAFAAAVIDTILSVSAGALLPFVWAAVLSLLITLVLWEIFS